MKFDLSPAPEKVLPKQGDAFIDNDGDLNIVLNDGTIVVFEQAGHSPWLRVSKAVGNITHRDVQRILSEGEEITLTI
ncbi:hypothetical protein [Pyruvatibacter sp.]